MKLLNKISSWWRGYRELDEVAEAERIRHAVETQKTGAQTGPQAGPPNIQRRWER